MQYYSILNKKNTSEVGTFKLGTVTGSSVFVVKKKKKKVSGKKLPYKIVGRREGDITSAYANTDKANNVLGWKAKSTLEEAMASAWKWEQKIRGQIVYVIFNENPILSKDSLGFFFVNLFH